MKQIHVVVGVLQNELGQLLIAQRPAESHLGGLWEFPGGKVDINETVVNALVRELNEEVGVRVLADHCQRLISLEYHYPDRTILLDYFLVEAFTGTARGAEGQPISWIYRHALADYPFPAANQALNVALILPDQYMITGPFDSEAKVLERIERALESGIRLLQLRFPDLDEAQYYKLITQVQSRCQQVGAQLIVKGEPDMLTRFSGVGLHLTADQLDDPRVISWALSRQSADAAQPGMNSSTVSSMRQWLAASCHNVDELRRAAELSVDFVTFSPVAPTLSHPEQAPAGWQAAEQFVRQATMPVFLLGGMQVSDNNQAKRLGAQGIAAISPYWR